MKSRLNRILVLVLGATAMFAAAVIILLQLIPAPRRQTDYLVIGTLATFATLAVVFVVLISTYIKDPALFFKRRKVDPQKDEM